MKLAAAIERGAPFKQSWTRTSWYYNVKAKAREMQMINQILLEDIEHSEGRMDGLTTADYIASIEDDEDEDADEPFVRTVRRPFVPSPPAPVLEEVVKEEVEEVMVKRKRRSSKEIKELKEKKIAEKALKKSLKCLPKSGKKNKTFTFPVLHEPVHIRQHFYDSDGDLMTANADKLRGY